jgi:hypothetical protein
MNRTQACAERRMERDLEDARSYLGCTRLTADRCRHETVTQTTLWVFDGKRQIGVAAREDGRWRASHMLRGMPTTERRFATLLEALGHVMAQDKGNGDG